MMMLSLFRRRFGPPLLLFYRFLVLDYIVLAVFVILAAFGAIYLVVGAWEWLGHNWWGVECVWPGNITSI